MNAYKSYILIRPKRAKYIKIEISNPVIDLPKKKMSTLATG